MRCYYTKENFQEVKRKYCRSMHEFLTTPTSIGLAHAHFIGMRMLEDPRPKLFDISELLCILVMLPTGSAAENARDLSDRSYTDTLVASHKLLL